MDKAVLVGPDIEAARTFLEQLESSGVPITAALWQWDGFLASDTWELDIATPLVDELGLMEAYRKVREVLEATSESPFIDLLNINLFTPEAWFIKSLRRTFQGRRDLVLSRRPVGDHTIERGYLYFVK